GLLPLAQVQGFLAGARRPEALRHLRGRQAAAVPPPRLRVDEGGRRLGVDQRPDRVEEDGPDVREPRHGILAKGGPGELLTRSWRRHGPPGRRAATRGSGRGRGAGTPRKPTRIAGAGRAPPAAGRTGCTPSARR